MNQPEESAAGRVVIPRSIIGSLAPVTIRQPAGTYALTPASRITLRTIADRRELFKGVGVDWGCGTGCLAIVAAKLPAVERVVGLDKIELNVEVAQQNAIDNGCSPKVVFLHSDSYLPSNVAGRKILDELVGSLDFIVANPPASPGDDGFSFRRLVLSGGSEFLKDGAVALLQISIQYGTTRIERLASETPGFTHEEMVGSSDWVEFDQGRSDLRHQLEEYAIEEQRGGIKYAFGDPRRHGQSSINAREALDLFQETGVSPLTQWQIHLYRYRRGVV